MRSEEVQEQRSGESKVVISFAAGKALIPGRPFMERQEVTTRRREEQVVFLEKLRSRHGINASEMSRLSRVFAQRFQQATLAFKQQAAWAWLNGTRTPNGEHRRALAMMFQIPLDQLNLGLDGPQALPDTRPVIRPAVVHLRKGYRDFIHRLTVRSDIDFSRAAIYRNWGDLFEPPAVRLRRHFGRCKASLFGWIPDHSMSPLVHHARSLVPLNDQRAALGDATTIDKRIWFLYLPGGQLDFGIAFQEGRWLHLSKPNFPHAPAQQYLRSRIDLVGYVSGRVLFHIDLV